MPRLSVMFEYLISPGSLRLVSGRRCPRGTRSASWSSVEARALAEAGARDAVDLDEEVVGRDRDLCGLRSAMRRLLRSGWRRVGPTTATPPCPVDDADDDELVGHARRSPTSVTTRPGVAHLGRVGLGVALDEERLVRGRARAARRAGTVVEVRRQLAADPDPEPQVVGLEGDVRPGCARSSAPTVRTSAAHVDVRPPGLAASVRAPQTRMPRPGKARRQLTPAGLSRAWSASRRGRPRGRATPSSTSLAGALWTPTCAVGAREDPGDVPAGRDEPARAAASGSHPRDSRARRSRPRERRRCSSTRVRGRRVGQRRRGSRSGRRRGSQCVEHRRCIAARRRRRSPRLAGCRRGRCPGAQTRSTSSSVARRRGRRRAPSSGRLSSSRPHDVADRRRRSRRSRRTAAARKPSGGDAAEQLRRTSASAASARPAARAGPPATVAEEHRHAGRSVAAGSGTSRPR